MTNVINLAAERAKRRPNEPTLVAPELPCAMCSDIPAAHCPVCGDPDGVECCEYGRPR